MAITVATISAFAKEYAEQIASRSLLGGSTLQLFGTRFDATNVGSVKVPYTEVTPVLASFNCTNAPTGTTAFKQAELTTVGIEVFTDFCPTTLRSYFPAQNMSQNILDAQLPYEGQLIMQWADGVMAKRETLAWMGQVSNGDLADGLYVKLSGDTTRLHVTGYTSLTISNIDDAVDAIVAALPGTVKLGQDQVYVFLSVNDFYLYQSQMVNAFGTLAVNNAPQPNANGSVWTMPYLKLPKIKLVANQAFGDTQLIVAGASKNFILAGSTPDTTTFNTGLDQYQKKVWVDFGAIQGVGYYFGDQIATNF